MASVSARDGERGGSTQVALCEIGVDERDELYEMAVRFWEELMPHARSDTPAALAFWRAVGYDLASYRMRQYFG